MNPFAEWTKKTTEVLARDQKGLPCDPAAPEAAAWCAAGWFLKQTHTGFNEVANMLAMAADTEWMRFQDWFLEDSRGKSHGPRTIIEANDCFGWRPQDFYNAWERFKEAEGDRTFVGTELPQTNPR